MLCEPESCQERQAVPRARIECNDRGGSQVVHDLQRFRETKRPPELLPLKGPRLLDQALQARARPCRCDGIATASGQDRRAYAPRDAGLSGLVLAALRDGRRTPPLHLITFHLPACTYTY